MSNRQWKETRLGLEWHKSEFSFLGEQVFKRSLSLPVYSQSLKDKGGDNNDLSPPTQTTLREMLSFQTSMYCWFSAGEDRRRFLAFFCAFISPACSAASHLNVCHAPCQSTERNNYLLKLIIPGTALALIAHWAAVSYHKVRQI